MTSTGLSLGASSEMNASGFSSRGPAGSGAGTSCGTNTAGFTSPRSEGAILHVRPAHPTAAASRSASRSPVRLRGSPCISRNSVSAFSTCQAACVPTLRPSTIDLVAERKIERSERDGDREDGGGPKQPRCGLVSALGEDEADDDQRRKRRQIEQAAVEAWLDALPHRAPGKADEPVPAPDLHGDRHDRREAGHEQRGPRRRNAEEAIERKAEIDQHEHADRHDVGECRGAVWHRGGRRGCRGR